MNAFQKIHNKFYYEATTEFHGWYDKVNGIYYIHDVQCGLIDIFSYHGQRAEPMNIHTVVKKVYFRDVI